MERPVFETGSGREDPNVATRTSLLILAMPTLAVASAPSRRRPRSSRPGRAGRAVAADNQTPEQREASAKAAHEKEAALPRPIAALDSVWIEELTYLEVRDAMKAGKTTALVFAGSTEQNGPYMAGGKHQYAIRLVGEAIARKLGNALIAPVIAIEAGNPENKYLEWGSLYLTQETFQAVAPRHRDEPQEPGLQEHHPAGRQRRQYRRHARGRAGSVREVGRRGRHLSHPRVLQLDEQGRRARVRRQSNGIPEKINADGIHDEYGLTAVMMAYDPKLVRFDERVTAGKTTINGIEHLGRRTKTIEMGKKIVEFRAKVGGRRDQEGDQQVTTNIDPSIQFGFIISRPCL